MIKARQTWLPLALCVGVTAGCGFAASQPTVERITAPALDQTGAVKATGTPGSQNSSAATPATTTGSSPTPTASTTTDFNQSGTTTVKFTEATKTNTPDACQYFKAKEVSKVLGRKATLKEDPGSEIGKQDHMGAHNIQHCVLSTASGDVTYVVKKHQSNAARVMAKHFKIGKQDIRNKPDTSLEKVTIGDFGAIFLVRGEKPVHILEFAVDNYSVAFINDRKETNRSARELKKLAKHTLKQAKKQR